MALKKIEIQSNKKIEFLDITQKIDEIIKETGVKEGIAITFTRHTTSGLTINENEMGLVRDMEKILEELIPQKSYAHNKIDNNARSHLQSLLLEHSLVIPIENSSLALGTWQKVFFVELDGPRTRREVLVKILKRKSI
jgi:secondary thiamine-phosphate synthase enzyme